jgi:xanthine/CO dehydrogenase XdhC/CoxF family maturation factor
MSVLEQQYSLNRDQVPYVVATVVRVIGSASARPGAKALFNHEGKNIAGWVGGGCAEAMVARNAVEALSEGSSRVIEVDLDDEIFGAGIPCGGKMEVYIEPYGPRPQLFLAKGILLSAELTRLAEYFGHEIKESELATSQGFNIPHHSTEAERALLYITEAIVRGRGFAWEPLRVVKETGREWLSLGQNFSRLILVGRGRIVEECARLAAMLHWPVTILGHRLDLVDYPKGIDISDAQPDFENFMPQKGDFIILASHHPSDPELIARSLEHGANYIGFVASEKRSRLAIDFLRGREHDLASLHAPAGIELRSRNPAEIALSLFAEMIWIRRGGPSEL